MSEIDAIHKLLEEVGYIRGKVDGMDDKIAKQNGSVADLTKRMNAYDITFGKMGVVVIAITFFITQVFNFGVDYLKSKFLS